MQFMHNLHKNPTCGRSPSRLDLFNPEPEATAVSLPRRCGCAFGYALNETDRGTHNLHVSCAPQKNPDIALIINPLKTANSLRRNHFQPPPRLIRANITSRHYPLLTDRL
jgi:hypothetical protein